MTILDPPEGITKFVSVVEIVVFPESKTVVLREKAAELLDEFWFNFLLPLTTISFILFFAAMNPLLAPICAVMSASPFAGTGFPEVKFAVAFPSVPVVAED